MQRGRIFPAFSFDSIMMGLALLQHPQKVLTLGHAVR
jgi:hypothetical protein